MKRTAIIRRSALRAKTAMKRTAMKHRRATLSAAERRSYAACTEAARTDEGFLVCALCGRGLLDGDAERDHVIKRSQGGPTTEANLRLLCRPCHWNRHDLRVQP